MRQIKVISSQSLVISTAQWPAVLRTRYNDSSENDRDVRNVPRHSRRSGEVNRSSGVEGRGEGRVMPCDWFWLHYLRRNVNRSVSTLPRCRRRPVNVRARRCHHRPGNGQSRVQTGICGSRLPLTCHIKIWTFQKTFRTRFVYNIHSGNLCTKTARRATCVLQCIRSWTFNTT